MQAEGLKKKKSRKRPKNDGGGRTASGSASEKSASKRSKPGSTLPRNRSFTSKEPISLVNWRDVDADVHLSPTQCCYLSGTALIQVLSGCIQIFGKDIAAGAEPLRVHTEEQTGGAVALCVHNANPQVPCIGGITHVRVRSIPEAASDASSLGAPSVEAPMPSFELLTEESLTSSLHRVRLSTLWVETASQIASHPQPPAVAVCGSKGTGKSTFARFLVNQLLNTYPAVCFIDTDCGQPEFGPPGVISARILSAPLLEPPASRTPPPALATVFIGEPSPEADPGAYLAGVAALESTARTHAQRQGLPVVLNTHGWIRGLGLDVLADALYTVAPTHVVQLEALAAARNLPRDPFWPGAENVTRLPLPSALAAETDDAAAAQLPDQTEASGKPARRSAAAARALGWLGWAARATGVGCGHAGRKGDNDAFMAAGDALAAATPLEADLRTLNVRATRGAIDDSERATALNGKLVGLCSSAALAGDAGPLVCEGVGYVRAVSGDKVYLLTDVDDAAMAAVDTLVIGVMQLPHNMLHTRNFISPYMNLFSLATEGTGAAPIRSRNQVLRLSQM